MNRKALTAGVVLAAATSFVAPSSAQASQPLELGSYADSWREDGTYCGRDERVDVEVVGHVVVRQGPAGAPELYAHDNYLLTHHHIGADGSWWTRLNGNFRIASIAHVGPTTWRIVQQDAGRTWNLTSESGKSVWADRGLGRFTFEVDTLGDDDPDNDEWSFVGYESHGQSVVGNYEPGSVLCDFVEEALAIG